MIAQAYFQGELMVRIFADDDEAIADLRLDDATPKAADESLRRLKLYRRSEWHRREWGLEAKLK